MKYVDPTEARKARDDEDRRRKKAEKPDFAKGVRDVIKQASGKGKGGGMKATAAVYKYAAKKPRKVL